MSQHICHQEQRIANMEANMSGQNHDIQNLVKRLDGLTRGLWALVLTLIPATLSFFAFLVWQVINNLRKP